MIIDFDSFTLPVTEGALPIIGQPACGCGGKGAYSNGEVSTNSDYTPEIIVYGTRPSSGGGGSSSTGGEDGWDTSVEGPPPADNDYDELCENIWAQDEAQFLDMGADLLAQRFAAYVLAQADHDQREYGVVIYRDAEGFLFTTEIRRGDLYTASERPSASLSVSGIGSYSQIIGVIHSHPSAYMSAEELLLNRYPSGGPDDPGGQDWPSIDNLVSQGLRTDIFRHYIIGPDDVLREYAFNDRDTTSLGPTLAVATSPCGYAP